MKLYELSYIRDKNSLSQPLSYSHSIDKLYQSVPWAIYTSVSGQGFKVRESRDEKGKECFPKYVICEVNFII